MASFDQLDLTFTTPASPDVHYADAVGGTWRLEWQKRGGRAGEDWVVRLGIMVQGNDGVVVPLHQFLRATLREFCAQLSGDQLAGNPNGQRDARSVEMMAQATIQYAEGVVNHPTEMPENFAATCAVAMLWGNFLDTLVAILDSSTSVSPPTLCVDATTMAVVSPANYSRKRARIAGAEPCIDFYAVSGPDRQSRGWDTYTDEGNLSPSLLWGLMNALNCQFPGPASAGKESMREYCMRTTKRFMSPLHEEGVTREEIMALGAASMDQRYAL